MYAMSTWALFTMTAAKFHTADGFVLPRDPVPWAGVVLLALAAVMLVEAVRAIALPPDRGHPQRGGDDVPSLAAAHSR
jgi:hypothetical protein